MRSEMSETAPAGNGETTRIGRLGKDDCASAAAAANPSAIAATRKGVAKTPFLLAAIMRFVLFIVLIHLGSRHHAVSQDANARDLDLNQVAGPDGLGYFIGPQPDDVAWRQ